MIVNSPHTIHVMKLACWPTLYPMILFTISVYIHFFIQKSLYINTIHNAIQEILMKVEGQDLLTLNFLPSVRCHYDKSHNWLIDSVCRTMNWSVGTFFQHLYTRIFTILRMYIRTGEFLLSMERTILEFFILSLCSISIFSM